MVSETNRERQSVPTVWSIMLWSRLQRLVLLKCAKEEARKLTEADVRHLKILSTRDRRETTAYLQAEMNASRSESEKIWMTISRRLTEQGLKGRIAAKKPLLRPANIQKPLRFTREHKRCTVDDWKKVLWTDESKYELLSQHRRVYVCRKAGERFDARCIPPTMKHGGDSITVQYGVPFEEPLITCRRNGNIFQRMLCNLTLPLYF